MVELFSNGSVIFASTMFLKAKSLFELGTQVLHLTWVQFAYKLLVRYVDFRVIISKNVRHVDFDIGISLDSYWSN